VERQEEENRTCIEINAFKHFEIEAALLHASLRDPNDTVVVPDLVEEKRVRLRISSSHRSEVYVSAWDEQSRADPFYEATAENLPEPRSFLDAVKLSLE
jgi:hypothetical protein